MNNEEAESEQIYQHRDEFPSSVAPALPVASKPSRQYEEDLQVLDQSSSQLLLTLGKSSLEEVTKTFLHPFTESAREILRLRGSFLKVKNALSGQSLFLSAPDVGLTQPSGKATRRKANFAAFFGGVFAADVPLEALEKHFLDVFVPENGRLLKAQASLYLELKTQTLIARYKTSAETLNDQLSRIFDEKVGDVLLTKRPGTNSLVPSEKDFIKRLVSRRDILHTLIEDKAMGDLPHRYKWDHFVRETHSYLAKNVDTMISPASVPRSQGGRLVSVDAPQLLDKGNMEGQFSIHDPTEPPAQNETAVNITTQPLSASIPVILPDRPQEEDFVAKAARAAQIALEGPGPATPYPFSFPQINSPAPAAPTPPPLPPIVHPAPPQTIFQHYNPSLPLEPRPVPTSLTVPPSMDSIPHPSQSAPTQILYERARQALATKPHSPAPPPPRPTSPHPLPADATGPMSTTLISNRRVWTPNEESALMAGLDLARGPHWSAILTMFGPGGTIDESLKDRNQVQLKDKARNLKLFFLKAGTEMPYYLREVTGDLGRRSKKGAGGGGRGGGGEVGSVTNGD